MADEEELLRQAKVLAAVDQEEHDGEGEPNRHGRDGRAHLQDLGGLYNEANSVAGKIWLLLHV